MSSSTEDLLEIPDFLKRKPGETPTPKLKDGPKFDLSKGPSQNEPKLTVEEVKPVPIPPKVWGFIIKETLEDYIDEGRIDDGFDLISKYKKKVGLLGYLKETFTEAKWEWENARGEELSEYFENVTDEEIEKRLRGYVRYLQDISNVTQNKRAGRKKTVRTKVSKAVSNVTYKTNDSDLKIVSLDPTEIVGKHSLVTFNTKSRRVSYFIAADEAGLQISGTTIKNFDEEKSMSKTLRKPEEQINYFRSSTTERRIEVLFEDINGKTFRVSGRLNKDTLLLKVFK